MIDCKVVGVPDSLVTRLGFDPAEFVKTKVALGDDKLIHTAINRITISTLGHELRAICVGHSGGKDSVLVRWLTDQAPRLDYIWSLHNPKTEGPNAVHELTQRFLYSIDGACLFLRGDPTEHGFKLQIDGTRMYEATRSDGRSTDFVRDGVSVPRSELQPYVQHGLFGMSFCYPIYDWTDMQVWAAIDLYQIPYSREYLVI